MVVSTLPREHTLLRAATVHRASRSSTSLPSTATDGPAPSFISFLQSVAPVPRDSLNVPTCSKRRASSVYSSRSSSAAHASDQAPPSPRTLRESVVTTNTAESASSTTQASSRDSLPSPTSYASSEYSPPSSVFEPRRQKVSVFRTVTGIDLTFLDEDEDDSAAESPDGLYNSIRLWRESFSSQSSQLPHLPTDAESWFDDDDRFASRPIILTTQPPSPPAADARIFERRPIMPSQARRRSSAPQLMRAARRRTLTLEPPVGHVATKTISADPNPSQGLTAEISTTARPSTAQDTSSRKQKSRTRPRVLWLPNAPSLFTSRSLRSKSSPSKAGISGPVHLQPNAASGRPTGIAAMLGRSKTAPAGDGPRAGTTEERASKAQTKRTRLREDLKASIRLVGETSPNSTWANKQKCHDI